MANCFTSHDGCRDQCCDSEISCSYCQATVGQTADTFSDLSIVNLLDTINVLDLSEKPIFIPLVNRPAPTLIVESRIHPHTGPPELV